MSVCLSVYLSDGLRDYTICRGTSKDSIKDTKRGHPRVHRHAHARTVCTHMLRMHTHCAGAHSAVLLHHVYLHSADYWCSVSSLSGLVLCIVFITYVVVYSITARDCILKTHLHIAVALNPG